MPIFINSKDDDEKGLQLDNLFGASADDVIKVLKGHDAAIQTNRTEHEDMRKEILQLPKRAEFSELRRDTSEMIKDAANGMADSVHKAVSIDIERSEARILSGVRELIKEELKIIHRENAEDRKQIEQDLNKHRESIEKSVPEWVERAEKDRQMRVIDFIKFWALVFVSLGGVGSFIWGLLLYLKYEA